MAITLFKVNPLTAKKLRRFRDDWGKIAANFSRSISGVASIRASSIDNLPPRRDWLSNDYQEVVPCNPVMHCSDGCHSD